MLEANLEAIDRAIAQCREALLADPANVYLNTYLAETRRRKLELLRRATALVDSRELTGAVWRTVRTMILLTCRRAGGLRRPFAETAALRGAHGAGRRKPRRTQTRPPDTDETVTVAKGTRLTVNNFGGEVIVRAWDRDSVRVQARHSSRTRVAIRPGNPALTISVSGVPMSVDFEINVPVWMPIKIEGTYIYISVEGTQADVAAETVRGDITIKGGSSFVTAKSIEGEVILENVRGRINANSTNQGITVTGATGEIRRRDDERPHLAEQCGVRERRRLVGQRQHQVRRIRDRQRQVSVLHAQRQHLGRGAGDRPAPRSVCAPTTGVCAPTSSCRAAERPGVDSGPSIRSGREVPSSSSSRSAAPSSSAAAAATGP